MTRDQATQRLDPLYVFLAKSAAQTPKEALKAAILKRRNAKNLEKAMTIRAKKGFWFYNRNDHIRQRQIVEKASVEMRELLTARPERQRRAA